MNNRNFVDWIRSIVSYLQNGGELNEASLSQLESAQDRISSLFGQYEDQAPPEFATALRDLMLEALQLLHDGLEDLFEYAEEPAPELLTDALGQVEEGNDILESLRYTASQDSSWAAQASMG